MSRKIIIIEDDNKNYLTREQEIAINEIKKTIKSDGVSWSTQFAYVPPSNKGEYFDKCNSPWGPGGY